MYCFGTNAHVKTANDPVRPVAAAGVGAVEGAINQQAGHAAANRRGCCPRPRPCLRRCNTILISSIILLIVSFILMIYPHIGGRPSWYSYFSPCAETSLEIQESFDAELEARIVQDVRRLMSDFAQRDPRQPMKRGQHAKTLACLRGSFKVLDNVPEEYKHGIFAKPDEFKAWIRFSPGQSDIQPDSEKHARGMAIKLMGVPGEKLLDDEKNTQDFVLLHSPVFFTGNNEDYIRLIPNMDNPLKIIDFHAATWKMMSMIVYVAKLLSWNDNPLSRPYYSTTPYRLGDSMAVKYSVIPCAPLSTEYQTGPAQMRSAIRSTLDPVSGKDVCYNFYVQKRVSPCSEPIEDPTIPWMTEQVHVATLHIPRQNFMHADLFNFCEDLSYNPWHSIAAHKPLGSINHVRKAVYEASVKMRAERGKYRPIEPTGDEEFQVPLSTLSFDYDNLNGPAGDTRLFSFQSYADQPGGEALVHIPHHVKGVPPGEEFEATTFLALLMRMFIGDHREVEETLLTDVDDSFWEESWEQALASASKLASGAVIDSAMRSRFGELLQKNIAPKEVDDAVKQFRNRFFSKIGSFFRSKTKEPKNQDFATAIDTITTILKKTSRADMSKFTDPQDYEQLFVRSFATDMPWIVKDNQWRRDDAFAAQFIRGVNPTSIRRMSETRQPPGLKLDQAHILIINQRITQLRPPIASQPPQDQEETFETVLAKGEIFYAEYSILHGLARASDTFIHEPIVLFTLTNHEEPSKRALMPLAVQLEDGRTFYPPLHMNCNDPANYLEHECLVWLFVKMHVMSADGNLHEAYVHLGMTHLLIEPIVVAARRQFSIEHPIGRVLRPHFHQTIAINSQGRESLINPNGMFERTTGLGIKGTLQLIDRGFERLNWTDWTFPRRMEAAGFPDIPADLRLTQHDTLPGYLYRDFCYDLWKATEDYMKQVVDTVYTNLESMVQDPQLQGFAFEVSSPLYGNIPSFPPVFTSKEQLVDSLTLIAFTASVQHSAVNFGQFDGYGFVPNRPLAMTAPIPLDLNQITMPYILSALPNRDRAFGQMAITFALSLPPSDSGDTIPLAWAVKNPSSLSPAPIAFASLVDRLLALNKTMRAVTKEHDWNFYTYVFPDLLAVSIAI